jgi:hypothetical protein
MYTRIIHTTLLSIYYSNMFRPSKGHLQGKRLIYFHSYINRCKIKFTEERVLCGVSTACCSNTGLIKLCVNNTRVYWLVCYMKQSYRGT